LATIGATQGILNAFLSESFPYLFDSVQTGPWTITAEAGDRSLLGEWGRQPTSIDALCVSPAGVVAIESKFDRDAHDGFGTCSRARVTEKTDRACEGFYGPGSDRRTGTAAWCRLEMWEGRRSPRLYWTLGKAYFKPSVFQRQVVGETCPFSGPTFQLMRNFLFAASVAPGLAGELDAVVPGCGDAGERLRQRRVPVIQADTPNRPRASGAVTAPPRRDRPAAPPAGRGRT